MYRAISGAGVEVERAESADPAGVVVVLDAGLQDPLERDQPDERERWQQRQPERIERGSDSRRGREQTKGNEPP